MRCFVQLAAMMVAGVFAVTPVHAQFGGVFAPFDPGFWGAGYWGYGNCCAPAAPAYGGYYSSYSPVWSDYATTPAYSASYASSSVCDPCCSPCGTSCGGTGCTGPGCNAVGTDTLKPSEDPNFRSGAPAETAPARDPQREFGRDGVGRDGDRDEFLPPRDRYERESPALDGFDAPATSDPASRNPAPGSGSRLRDDETWSPSGSRPAPGTGTVPASGNEDGLFPEDNFDTLRNTNKPPMSDPLDTDGFNEPAAAEPATEPQTEKADENADDFLPSINPQSFRPSTRSTIMVSRMRDVVPSVRLARRSVPTARPDNAVVRASAPQQIRWISAPAVDGSVLR